MRSWTCLAALLAAGALAAAESPAPPEPVSRAEEGGDLDGALELDGEAYAPATLLTLDMAQRRALAGNPSLHAVQARVAQAEERVKQVRSRYFPNVDVSYSASRTSFPSNEVSAARSRAVTAAVGGLANALPNIISSGGANLTPLSVFGLAGETLLQVRAGRRAIETSMTNYQAGVTVSYVVFDGFSRRFSLLAARYGAMESAAGQREVQRLLLDAVAQSYHGIQLARENMAIAEADEEFNERLLRDAQARRRVGAGSLSDVLNFEVRLRAARAQRLRAERDFEAARIALASLMGVSGARLEEDIAVEALQAEAVEEMIELDEEARLAAAYQHRPDLERDEYAARRAGAGVRERRAPFYPQVRAFAAHEAQLSDDSRFDSGDFATTVGVSVSYNVFAGGRDRAALNEARLGLRAAEYDLRESEITIAREVRTAVLDLVTAQQELILQRATAEHVERNRDLVEREYNAGQASLTRLNEAQRDLIEARSRLAQALVGLRRAWHALDVATGEVLARFEDALE